MALIETSPVKSMFGKKTGRYVARLGTVSIEGDTREHAKANLLEHLDNLDSNHARRRYLFCGDNKTILVVHWSNNAWAYDIIDSERDYACSCLMSSTCLDTAIDRARSHADQSYGGVIKQL